MQERGLDMIDEIQGPPGWDGPDVLLRQTSFRALSEARTFTELDGTRSQGALRVRFGEVEARGIALTPAGRDLYEQLVREVDTRLANAPGRARQDVAAEVWVESMPRTEEELCRRGLAFVTYAWSEAACAGSLTEPQRSALASGELTRLLDEGVLVSEPIVYEDFLPRSAAGIFASNLADRGRMDGDQGGAAQDAGWMSEVIGRPVNLPEEVYLRESRASLSSIESALGRPVSV
jgi:uncharacterized glyoxalase superfamily metalloenzyme YdcJ